MAAIFRNPWTWVVLALMAVFAYVLARLGRYTIERMNSPFKYFALSEFDSPDAPGSGEQFMDRNFVGKLDRMRAQAGFPFIINSGFRTVAHNKKVRGTANSAHIRGRAADIRAVTDAQKLAIVKAAIDQGITRIGWGRTFIHVDDDPSLPQNVVWAYEGVNRPAYAATFSKLRDHVNNLA